MSTRPNAATRSSRALAAAVLAASIVAALSGCGTVTTAAPPLVVCGTTLSRSAAGAVLLDVARGGRVGTRTIGGLLFLKVSDDCDRGATIRWTPAAAATRLAEARSADGLPAAVVLRPNEDRFTITLDNESGRSVVEVDLAPETPAPSPSGVD